MLRPLVLAGSGILVLSAGAGALIYRFAPGTPLDAAITPTVLPHVPAHADRSPPPVSAPSSQAAGAAVIAPSFDIVRIAPGGQAVIAGRAAPGAKVTIEDQGKTIGTATSDQTGSWLFIPPTPLPAGPSALTLSERTTAGTTVAGNASALLVVPAPAATPTHALAVLSTSGAAPRVLDAPGRTPGKLALEALDYGQSGGDIRFAGTTDPAGAVPANRMSPPDWP